MSPNIRYFVHKNPRKSRFWNILSMRVFNGEPGFGFVFEPMSDNCFWPVSASAYELLKDGWEVK